MKVQQYWNIASIIIYLILATGVLGVTAWLLIKNIWTAIKNSKKNPQ